MFWKFKPRNREPVTSRGFGKLQTKMRELKNLVDKMKNSLEGLTSRSKMLKTESGNLKMSCLIAPDKTRRWKEY